MIRVALLGSTGSIGRSTLEVIGRHADRFRVVGMAANRSLTELLEQVATFRPARAVVADDEIRAPATQPSVEWRSGREALLDLASDDGVDVVVNALVGAAGLEPSIRALRAGKRLALANKESLVAGGPLVLEAARAGGGELVPIDSEHSAILQCLEGCDMAHVERVVLTASGGPFRELSLEALRGVTPADALKHPTWVMGAKITVDSATLANKALEVIEAHFLYGIPYDSIDVVVHPQSIVHSFVEFVDGSVVAQLGFPTMELPILYALSYPERVADSTLRTFDAIRASPLTFEDVDRKRFPLFGLGVGAGRSGGMAPAVFNAANEIAVEAFLEGTIGFTDMAEVVQTALDHASDAVPRTVDELLEADAHARRIARDVVRGVRAVSS